MHLTSDNVIIRMLGKAGGMILINFLVILCSLPLITIGASLTAGFSCLMLKEEPEEHSMFREFFHVFASNLKKGIPVWLLLVLGFVIAAGDLIYAFQGTGGLYSFYQIFGIVLLLVFITITIWVFPLVARYENTVTGHLKNAFVLAFGYLPRTLLLWCLWLIPIVLCYFYPSFLVLAGWFWVTCGIAVQMWVTCKIIRIEKIEQKGKIVQSQNNS